MKESSSSKPSVLPIVVLLVGAVAVGQLLSFALRGFTNPSGSTADDKPTIVEADGQKKSNGDAESKTESKDDAASKDKDADKNKDKDKDSSTSSKSEKSSADGKNASSNNGKSQSGNAQSQGTGNTSGGSANGGSSGSSSGGSSQSGGGTTYGSSNTSSGGSDTDGGSNVTPAYPSSSSVYGSGSPQTLASANSAQRAIVEAAKATPPYPNGYSAAWVEEAFANAGYGFYQGNSSDLYNMFCGSSDLSALKVGMVMGVSSHPHTTDGAKWGHVGIYIGDGQVMDCVDGGVRTMSVSEWLDYYGVTVPVRWGWMGDVSLV